MANIKLVLVPYKGNAPALAGLIGGEVQLMISDAGVAKPHVDAKRLKALAVTTSQATALAPGLPTVAESGLPGYEAVGLTAMFAPARTPDTVVRRLNQEIARVLSTAEIKEKFFNHGTEAMTSTPEQLASRIKSEMTQMAKVIKDAGIKAD